MVHVSKDFQLHFLHDESSKAYVCIFTDEILEALRHSEEHNICMDINHVTCTDNETLYSKSEVKAARTAREEMKRLCYPSDTELITAMGQTINVLISTTDVLRATSIYGKDVASLKRKTVNRGNTNAPSILSDLLAKPLNYIFRAKITVKISIFEF